MNEIFSIRSRMISAGTGNPADDFSPYLEFFPFEGAAESLGAILVLPGGGYGHRAYHEGNPIAKKFNELGFHAFVLQYRVAPYTYPAPQQDALRAIRFIRGNAAKFRVEPNQIAVLGFSAGGHLAGSCGLAHKYINSDEGDELDAVDCRPNAMILCYPVISISKAFGHVGSGNFLFGCENFQNLPGAAEMELQNQVTSDVPPTFLWHTSTDQGVPVRNSTALAENLWKNDVPCELHVFPSGRHGLGLGAGRHDLKHWPELAARFLMVTAHFKGNCNL